ncbi:hypothetical protein H6H03_11505 [Nostoc paludosum FACHB-159]|uniref:Uncharacterized protein n=1 Tax=Nostoc paludosum FACHB-159 TaxID=2692908 RepID=A0ABR8K6S0_9NOSO|nr:hypothetical protein [Nostoc paludosum FACHB-159]
MATNWLRITHQSETIQLSWQRGYENPRLALDYLNFRKLAWYVVEFSAYLGDLKRVTR